MSLPYLLLLTIGQVCAAVTGRKYIRGLVWSQVELIKFTQTFGPPLPYISLGVKTAKFCLDF